MNLCLTKISRSCVNGVMRYKGVGPTPLVSDVVLKPLVSEKPWSSQNYRMLGISSTELWIQRKSAEVLALLQLFKRQRLHTHTSNNKGQNCMESKLHDLSHKHMHGHRLLDDIAHLYSLIKIRVP